MPKITSLYGTLSYNFVAIKTRAKWLGNETDRKGEAGATTGGLVSILNYFQGIYESYSKHLEENKLPKGTPLALKLQGTIKTENGDVKFEREFDQLDACKTFLKTIAKATKENNDSLWKDLNIMPKITITEEKGQDQRQDIENLPPLLEEKAVQLTKPAKKKKLTDKAEKDFNLSLTYLQSAFGFISAESAADNFKKAIIGRREYRLYKEIENLIAKAETELNAQQQEEVAEASKNMAACLQQSTIAKKSPSLTKDEATTFIEVLKKHKAKPGWREIVGAIIGAIAGFIIGASLCVAVGPAAAFPAILFSAKGAGIGASLVAGATLGGFGTFWSRKDTRHAIDAVKSFVDPSSVQLIKV
ncbi:MAG TPA: hypothetical protein VHA13_06270 [Gammaproteobacteria bacterium]|nr:hypothetical protein [Gammaproteobacteria bacterium]